MDINTIKFDSNGLVVAIVCDAYSNEVIMQAFMNKEALEKTLKTKTAHYFSRSRNKLWLKGETSGHTQEVVSICSDCDNDSILLRVIQKGVACHTGEYSCFFNNLTTFKNICTTKALVDTQKTIKEREANPQEGSYTNYLLTHGKEKICKKIGEESTEVVISAMKNDNEELCSESADLLYHLVTLLHSQGTSIEKVMEVLQYRHASPRKREYNSN